MKRSEMIKLIKEDLAGTLSHPNGISLDDKKPYLDLSMTMHEILKKEDQIAEAILDLVEFYGMLPPTTMEVTKVNEKNKTVTFDNKRNEWEPEDGE